MRVEYLVNNRNRGTFDCSTIKELKVITQILKIAA
jgi:hypothetical protein